MIVLTSIRLLPTTRYAPLRFACARMLIELAESTNTFINVAPYILEVLEFSELKGKGHGKAGKAVDFAYAMRVPKPIVSTKSFQVWHFDID